MDRPTGSVTLEVAASLAGVDVGQIRDWAAIDGLVIEQRGRIETVLLDRVIALSTAARRRRQGSGRDALRARLADARSNPPK